MDHGCPLARSRGLMLAVDAPTVRTHPGGVFRGPRGRGAAARRSWPTGSSLPSSYSGSPRGRGGRCRGRGRARRPARRRDPAEAGCPGNPELGIGAVAPGVRVIDRSIVEALGVSDRYVEAEAARQEAEIVRRTAAFRRGAGRSRPRRGDRARRGRRGGDRRDGLAALRWARTRARPRSSSPRRWARWGSSTASRAAATGASC